MGFAQIFNKKTARSIIFSSWRSHVLIPQNLGNYLAHARFARGKEERWFVFRAKPEKRTTSPPARERSERVTK
ncbi:MAG: hypothetical protein U5L45_24420 [Saprospiraceae bacterium]|nr:hypothetical protein [Saprospiraceae bacterium]